MLREIIPRAIRARARAWITDLLRQPTVWSPPFVPLHPGEDSYVIPRQRRREQDPGAELPVPPRSLWLGYGSTEEEYLRSGEANVGVMLGILEKAGISLPPGSRILDFGCGAGRMIRFLRDLATTCEIWGADISGKHVLWCEQFLEPPFHFLLTTALPHLPFEDGSFDLVYAGSVFTHIDDLAKCWFVELRRILRSGGHLYVTIHDRNSIRLLAGEAREVPLAKSLRSRPEYEKFANSDFAMFTIGRGTASQVFYDADALCETLGRIYTVRSKIEGQYGYQTTLLLTKP